MKEKTEKFMIKIRSRVLSSKNKTKSISDLLSRIPENKSNLEIILLLRKLEHHSKIFHKQFVINSHRKFLRIFLIFGRKLILSEIRRYVDPIVARQEHYNHLNILSIIEIFINHTESINDFKIKRENECHDLDELSTKIIFTCKEVDTYLFEHSSLFTLINSILEKGFEKNGLVNNRILVLNSNKGLLPIILSKMNINAIACDDSTSNIELSININKRYNSNAIFFVKNENYYKFFNDLHFDLIIIQFLDKKITMNDIISDILKNFNNSKKIILHLNPLVLSEIVDITSNSPNFNFLIEKIESLGFMAKQIINYVASKGDAESNLFLLYFVNIKEGNGHENYN